MIHCTTIPLDPRIGRSDTRECVHTNRGRSLSLDQALTQQIDVEFLVVNERNLSPQQPVVPQGAKCMSNGSKTFLYSNLPADCSHGWSDAVASATRRGTRGNEIPRVHVSPRRGEGTERPAQAVIFLHVESLIVRCNPWIGTVESDGLPSPLRGDIER